MAQLSAHEDITRKLNGISDATPTAGAQYGYIDQIPGW